jgi:hypothetical protein
MSDEESKDELQELPLAGRIWQSSDSSHDVSIGLSTYFASRFVFESGELSAKKLVAEKFEPRVEAEGNEGVTVFPSGIGMRKPEAWLTLLLEDNLFFFRLTLPNQLEALSAVDFVMTDLSADEDERRVEVEVDSRLESRASSPS